MRGAYLLLGIGLLLPSACAPGHRLSVEGGTTVKIFALDDDRGSYGGGGSDGMVSLAATGVAGTEGLYLGISGVRWSGPYTRNTLVGTHIGYGLVADRGYFVRAGMGPYYGERTVRTSSHWTFGVHTDVGRIFNGGRNEFYVGFRHYSNGSAFDIGDSPNMSEEFLNCGFSVLF